MASEMLTAINTQYRSDLSEGSIRRRKVVGFDNASYAVIAKGNVFDHIEAKE